MFYSFEECSSVILGTVFKYYNIYKYTKLILKKKFLLSLIQLMVTLQKLSFTVNSLSGLLGRRLNELMNPDDKSSL